MIWFLLFYSIVFGFIGRAMAPSNEWWLVPVYATAIFAVSLGFYYWIG